VRAGVRNRLGAFVRYSKWRVSFHPCVEPRSLWPLRVAEVGARSLPGGLSANLKLCRCWRNVAIALTTGLEYKTPVFVSLFKSSLAWFAVNRSATIALFASFISDYVKFQTCTFV
jgi:hypothetical protein